jgi:hypothetical protein
MTHDTGGPSPPPLRGRVRERGSNKRRHLWSTPLPINAGEPALIDLPRKGGGDARRDRGR